MTLEIVPATAELIDAYYAGARPGPTLRGVVALLDGRPIAVAGVAYQGGQQLVFSDMKPEAKNYPVTIFKVAKRILRTVRGVAYATRNPDEPGADAFLKRLGFEPDGEVYICRG